MNEIFEIFKEELIKTYMHLTQKPLIKYPNFEDENYRVLLYCKKIEY